MVESPLVLFLGTDEAAKQKKLEQLQAKIFPPELLDLNYNVFYADDRQLNPQRIKEALGSFPTEGAKKRLCVIRRAHKLSQATRSFLLAEFKGPKEGIILLLDIPDVKGQEAFIDALGKVGAQIVRFKTESPLNVFDLGRAIIHREPEVALRLLSRLLTSREKSEKILGAIFWQWDHAYGEHRIAQGVYKKGLRLILDADKRLKSSSSAFARETLILEALVVKLAYLT